MELQANTTAEALPAITLKDRMYFVLVGGYLTIVMFFLLIAGRLDPGVSFFRLVKGAFRPRAKGTIERVHQEQGHCFVCEIDPGPVSDADGRSRVTLYEDGTPLPHPHCSHADIREKGGGRYSHWSRYLYFSTADGTDPRKNGRTYTWAE